MVASLQRNVIQVLVAVNRCLQSLLLVCVAKACEAGKGNCGEEGWIRSLNPNLWGQVRVCTRGNAQCLPPRVRKAKLIDQRRSEIVIPRTRRIVIVVVREYSIIVRPGSGVNRCGWLVIGLRQE